MQEMAGFHLRVLRRGSEERPERRAASRHAKTGKCAGGRGHSTAVPTGRARVQAEGSAGRGVARAEGGGGGGERRQTDRSGRAFARGQGQVHAKRAGKPSAGEWNLLTHGLDLKGPHQLPCGRRGLCTQLCVVYLLQP